MCILTFSALLNTLKIPVNGYLVEMNFIIWKGLDMHEIKLVVILFVSMLLHVSIQVAYGEEVSKGVLLLPADGDEWTEKTGGTGWNWFATGGWGAHYAIDKMDKKVGNGSLVIGGTNWSSMLTLSIGNGYRDTLGNRDYITTLATNDLDLCFWLKVEWLDPEHPASKVKSEFIVICSDGYDVNLMNRSRPGVKGKYVWTDGENLPWTKVKIKLEDFLLDNKLIPKQPYQFEKLGVVNIIGPAWSTVHIDGFHWEEREKSLPLAESSKPASSKRLSKIAHEPNAKQFAGDIEEKESLIKVTNGALGLVFDKKQGYDLVGITNAKSDYNFINVTRTDPPGGNLWRFNLITPVGRRVSINNSAECSTAFDVVDTDTGKIIHLYWNGISVSSEEKVIDIHAVVTLKHNSSLSLWRLEINNRSRKLGIETIEYPIVANIGKPRGAKEKEYFVYPWNKVPLLVENPLQDQYMSERTIQYDSCGMQVSTYLAGSNGLYLATHDPDGNLKDYRYYPETVNDTQVFSYTFTHFPLENVGKPNTDYVTSYDTVIGVYQGNWYEAAKIYRDWVVKDAFWCKKGPLYQRKDIPQWMLDTDIWMLWGAGDINEFKVFMEDLSIAAEIIWWQWRHKDTPGFDTEYPDYFPAVDWFDSVIEQLHKLGIPVMPYINGKSWCLDYTSPTYVKEGAQAYAVRKRSGEILTQHANGRNYAIMCAKTKFWQDRLMKVVERLVTEHKVDAVYFDQSGFGISQACFDASHGHPVGSGNSQGAGYREMMERIHKAVNKGSEPTIAFTTEGNAETVIGAFDGFLLAQYGPSNMVPFFQFVYHDYQICFGRWSGLDYGMQAHKRMGEFCTLVGQSFVWGDQLGWVFPTLATEQPKAANYLKRLGKARRSAKKFLLYGEMLPPPKLEKELPTITAEWWATGSGAVTFSPTVTSPVVLYSAWRAPDGTIGLTFTNITETSQTVSYSLDLKEYGLAEKGEYTACRVESDGKLTKLSDYQSSNISRSETLEPYSALVLQIAGKI